MITTAICASQHEPRHPAALHPATLQQRPLRLSLLRHVTLIALAVLLLGGCKLDRRGLIGLGSVSPQQFCPADTVTASFDLLAGETCPASVDCTPHFPNVGITSNPASFPLRVSTTMSAASRSCPVRIASTSPSTPITKAS